MSRPILSPIRNNGVAGLSFVEGEKPILNNPPVIPTKESVERLVHPVINMDRMYRLGYGTPGNVEKWNAESGRYEVLSRELTPELKRLLANRLMADKEELKLIIDQIKKLMRVANGNPSNIVKGTDAFEAIERYQKWRHSRDNSYIKLSPQGTPPAFHLSYSQLEGMGQSTFNIAVSKRDLALSYGYDVLENDPWNFGDNAYRRDDIHGTWVVDESARNIATRISVAEVLRNMESNKSKLRYNPLTEQQRTDKSIEDRVNSGEFRILDSGEIQWNGRTLSEDQVGFEVQSVLIKKSREKIEQLNDLLERISRLKDILKVKYKQEFDDPGFVKMWDFQMDGDKATGQQNDDPHFIQELENIIPDYRNNVGKEIWENGRGIPEVDEYGNENRHEIDHTWYKVTLSAIDNASEQVRNLIKKNSTQAEQLSVDFNTTNSRFNGLTEAMSNYIKSYYEAIKGFVS